MGWFNTSKKSTDAEEILDEVQSQTMDQSTEQDQDNQAPDTANSIYETKETIKKKRKRSWRLGQEPERAEQTEQAEQADGQTEQTDDEPLDADDEDHELTDDDYDRQDFEALHLNGKPAKEMGVNEYTDKLIEQFTRTDPQSINALDRGMITKDIFIAEVKRYIKSIAIPEELGNKVFKNFASFLWSYDCLDELIDDPDISDIKAISWDTVRIKVKGKRLTSSVKFRSPQHFARFVEHAAIKNKISVSDQNALQSFVDKDSNPRYILRFNISTKFVNSSEAPYLHIRKIPKKKYTVDELIEIGMFSRATADYLISAAANRDGILFTGKGASGKTTLLNVLLDYIPNDQSGLVIQENEELFSKHPDLMFQHTVMNRGEGKIQYDLQELARNGLLVDLDYFIIGEVKGGEALYMLNAAYTGHKCWATVHGASATEAINKLVDYIKYSSDYSRDEAMQMLTHINTVVFMKSFKVTEIAEVVGWDDKQKKLIYKQIPLD